MPEFECGRKFIYRQGAEDKAWNHRLEDDDSKINRIIKSLDLDIDVTKNLEEYSLALQQMIAIAKSGGYGL